MVMLITQKRTIALILSQLEKDDAITQAIKSFFLPYCDHNVVDWIKTRIQNNDQAVIAKVAELIAAPDAIVVSYPAGKLPPGYLVRTYCVGTVLWGDYIGSDGVTTTPLQIAAYEQSCT